MRRATLFLVGFLAACSSDSTTNPDASSSSPDGSTMIGDSGTDAKKDGSTAMDAGIDADDAGIVDGGPPQDGSSSDGGCGNLTLCGMACVDTKTDAKHCGSCNHDCLAGTCSAGKCNQATLVKNGIDPFRLAVDATYVYWTVPQHNGIAKCAKAGCNNTPAYLTSTQSATNGGRFLATDGNTLFWTEYSGEIWSCANAGCNMTPVSLASGQTDPNGIVVIGSDVYWTNYGSSQSATGTISKCATAGCNKTPTVLATGLREPHGLTTDGTYLYFSMYQPARIARCLASNCNATVTTIINASATSLASDGTNVFWPEGLYQKPIWACAVGGCNNTPTKMADMSFNFSIAIATDKTNIFFSDEKDVQKCAVGGCNLMPTDIASTSVNRAGDIVVDSQGVYFTDPSAGQAVMLVAK